MHLSNRFDFCSAHGHVSVKIRNSMPAPMDIQVRHGLQGIADATVSIRTTKSINITRAHKQISVWFLRELDHALSRSNSLQPGSTVKSNSLIYKKLDQVFSRGVFSSAVQLRWRDKKRRLSPSKVSLHEDPLTVGQLLFIRPPAFLISLDAAS